MTSIKPILACLSLGLLAACGNDDDRLLDADMLGQVFNREEPVAATPAQTANLVARALQSLNEPVMLTIIEDRKATAIMVPYGQNGPVQTWTTQEFQTVSLERGVITATRGLGDDLMSAETTAVANALRSGGGTVNRVWRTLDGTNAVIEKTATCQISSAGAETITLASGASLQTRRMVEDCGDGIRNAYWLDGSGRVAQSRQWVGSVVGYLTQQVVRR